MKGVPILDKRFTTKSVLYVFPQIISSGDYFFFGVNIQVKVIILNIAHWKSSPKYVVLLSHK